MNNFLDALKENQKYQSLDCYLLFNKGKFKRITPKKGVSFPCIYEQVYEMTKKDKSLWLYYEFIGVEHKEKYRSIFYYYV